MSDFDGLTKEELRTEVERIVQGFVPAAKCELWDYDHRIRCGLVKDGEKYEFSAIADTLDRESVNSHARSLRDRLL